MAYCRWSTDYFQCDVYVYEGGDGWHTHVAGRRVKHVPPDSIKAMYPRFDDPEYAHKYVAAEAAVKRWQKTLPHVVKSYPSTSGGSVEIVHWADSEFIDLATIGEEAGKSFRDSSPGECADRLQQLRLKGFCVPQSAIEALCEEQAELDNNPNPKERL